MNCFSYADQFSRIAIEAHREKCGLSLPPSRFQTLPEEFPIIEIRASICGISSSESLSPTGNLGPAFEPVFRWPNSIFLTGKKRVKPAAIDLGERQACPRKHKDLPTASTQSFLPALRSLLQMALRRQQTGDRGDGCIDSARCGGGDFIAESLHRDGGDHASARRLIERCHAGAVGQPGSIGVDGRRGLA